MTEQLGTVLVTGAGGAAAVTVLRSLAGHATAVAADIDPVAVGLYLAAPEHRVLLPRGDAPDFVDALLAAARDHGADLVVPTVDSELLRVSEAADRFAAHGIRLLVESPSTLRTCLDKLTLVERCAARVRVPRTVALEPSTATADVAAAVGEPFIVKPRAGAGGRGFRVVERAADLTSDDLAGGIMAQELLPGDEYSIDVLARPGGGVVAAVPRRRDKVDSGIAVAGRTVADPALEQFGRDVAEIIGAQTVVNVQAKLDADGRPALLEVNARFPGTMALTQAAGVDMPLLAVRAAFGHELPDRLGFREVAVVRHWDDVVVPVEEYGTIRSAVPV
ncbi:ATP-grasp domain-containing protein [Jatrophihabitans fulvus]